MLTARNATSVRHGVQRLNPESLENILTSNRWPHGAKRYNDSSNTESKNVFIVRVDAATTQQRKRSWLARAMSE